jgi:hypothetical protein
MVRIAYLPMLGILVVALAVFLVLNRRPVR